MCAPSIMKHNYATAVVSEISNNAFYTEITNYKN